MHRAGHAALWEPGRLLDEGPYVKAATGFDTVDLKVVHGRIEIQTTLPPELDVDIDIRRMTILTDTAKDPFVLAADVIANSLAYLFHTRPPEEKYQPLNTIEAVRRHRLAANFDAFNEWSLDYTGDGIWSHPNLVRLPEISPLNCRATGRASPHGRRRARIVGLDEG